MEAHNCCVDNTCL